MTLESKWEVEAREDAVIVRHSSQRRHYMPTKRNAVVVILSRPPDVVYVQQVTAIVGAFLPAETGRPEPFDSRLSGLPCPS